MRRISVTGSHWAIGFYKSDQRISGQIGAGFPESTWWLVCGILPMSFSILAGRRRLNSPNQNRGCDLADTVPCAIVTASYSPGEARVEYSQFVHAIEELSKQLRAELLQRNSALSENPAFQRLLPGEDVSA